MAGDKIAYPNSTTQDRWLVSEADKFATQSFDLFGHEEIGNRPIAEANTDCLFLFELCNPSV